MAAVATVAVKVAMLRGAEHGVKMRCRAVSSMRRDAPRMGA